MKMNQPPIIFFDGMCNLCCGWVQFIIRMDKKMKFKFTSMQSERGEKLLTSIGLNSTELKTIVYLRETHVFQESAAVLEILTDLGGKWKVFKIFHLFPKAALDNIYRYIAKRRYATFGKRASCLLPTPENEKRFLS